MPPEPKPAAKAKRKSKPLTRARSVESEMKSLDRSEKRMAQDFLREINKNISQITKLERQNDRLSKIHTKEKARINKRRQILTARQHTQS